MTQFSKSYPDIIDLPANNFGVGAGAGQSMVAKTPTEVCGILGLTPIVSLQPSNQSAYETYTATFTSTAASIIGTTTHQWYKQTNGAGAWNAIIGATSQNYTTPALDLVADQGNKYRKTSTNELGSTTSSEVTLTVAALQVLRYGPTTPAAKGSSLSLNTVWIPYRPITQTGTLTSVQVYFDVTGAYKLKVLRPGTTTWDEVASVALTATSGLNSLTSSDFGTISVSPGDIVGIFTSTARPSYDTTGAGCKYYYKFGETAASGNTLLYGPTVYNFQIRFTVTGLQTTSTTLFDQDFAGGALPIRWANNSATVWTFAGAKATNGAASVANSLNYNHCVGNLSNWTWYSDFTFDTSGARFCMFTRNAVQVINGTCFEVDQATNNLVIYHSTGTNGYSNNGGLTAVSTNATGITFATATTYRMTLTKSFRTLTFSIYNVAVPAQTYTLVVSVEDGTGTPGSGTLKAGFAYGQPALASIVGTVSVTRSKFIATTVTPDWFLVGDSITEGTGVTSSTLGYPRLIASDTGLSIMTSANGGGTSAHCANRLADELAYMRPTNVHFLMGTNDTIVSGDDPVPWEGRMSYMKDILEGLGITVTIGCIPPEAADTNPASVMNPYIIAQGWAKVRYDLALTNPATGATADRDVTKFYDSLHPNAAGNSAMRDRFRSDVGV